MKRSAPMSRRCVVGVSMAVVMAVLLTAPPYFAIDAASAGTRHTSIGHRWRWAPPSADEACRALLAGARPAAGAPAMVCPPPASRRADVVVRVNAVRLASELAVLLVAGLASSWVRPVGGRRQWRGPAARDEEPRA